MFNRPREAYEAALHANGPVIGVWRKGRVRFDCRRRVLVPDQLIATAGVHCQQGVHEVRFL